ncbi:MAG: T9SS type A sorting domain-containing protein [Cytophagaceae bacterium]
MIKFYCHFLFIFLCSALPSYSQSWGLDESFGTNGIKVINSDFNDEAHCVAVDANNKILVGGFFAGPFMATPEDFTIIRLNDNGSFDNTFGNNGKVIVSVFTHGGKAQKMKVLEDGKILVAGIANGASNCRTLCVVKLNSNGSLDESFNNTGIARYSTCLGNLDYKLHLTHLDIESSGKIVVFAWREYGPSALGLIMKLNHDGTFDTTFDEDGLLGIDGLAIFQAQLSSNSKYLINRFSRFVRILSNGELDTSFGTNGEGDISGFRPFTFFEDNLGKIHLLGYGFNSQSLLGSMGLSLAELNHNGLKNSAFGQNGIKGHGVYCDNGTLRFKRYFNLQNQFVGLGSTQACSGCTPVCSFSDAPNPCINITSTNTYDFIAYFFKSDGSLEDFGQYGSIIIPVSTTRNDEAYDGVIDNNGRIIMVGYVSTDVSQYYRDFAIVRLKKDVGTGVEEKMKESFSLYPNPGSGIFHVDLNSHVNQVDVKVTDMTGKIVFSGTENSSFKLNIENAPEGVYLLELINGNDVVRRRIVKQ